MTERTADVQPDPQRVPPLADFGVGIAHHFGGGVYAKETVIPAGVELTQHRHQHDHLSILAVGEVLVEVDGETRAYRAPACLQIKAGAVHKVTALTPAVWYCIHATDCTDPELVDHELVTP